MNRLVLSLLLFLCFANCVMAHQFNSTLKPNSTDTLKKETAEELVQRQLDAYNARDIEAFMATYSTDITLYSFPETITTKGHEQLRKKYTEMFENTPDLYCDLKKRMVIANKVIDHEYVRKNGNYINAVAIYEIQNGLIVKVTFIK